MPSTATSLYDLAAELLAASAAILATTTAGAPTVQYVSAGPPAYDCCDQLTVDVGIIGYGPFNADVIAGDAYARLTEDVVTLVPLNVTHLRCANARPSGGVKVTLPQVAKMTQDAQTVYEDGWVLWNGLRGAARSGSLFTGTPCRIFALSGANVIAPDGGCLGYAVSLVVELDGYSA